MYSSIDDFQTADRPNMSLFRDSFSVSGCQNCLLFSIELEIELPSSFYSLAEYRTKFRALDCGCLG